MSDKTPFERLLAGWPVYSVVLVFLTGYSNLYIDAKISAGIKSQTGNTAVVAALNTSVALNTASIVRFDSTVQNLSIDIRDLNSDVKATLRLLASE